MANLTGKTLVQRYFLREHIGAGGMADVYLAWDNKRSVRMAVKVLRRDLASNPRFFQMFAREAGLLRHLEHPNIARIYEFDREGDIVFLVMEYIDGESLKDAIQRRKKSYSLDEVSLILQPLSAALYYAHQQNVFHCDVKPANILLNVDGQVYLSDFGVARLAAENISGGTPPYMAPEQFTGGNVDARTDVYALGITIYEMFSGGVLPYQGEESSKGSTLRDRIAWEHLNLPLPPLRNYNPGLPDSVETVVATALSKNNQHRFENTMRLREAYEHARMQGGRVGTSISTMMTFRQPEPQSGSKPRPTVDPQRQPPRKPTRRHSTAGPSLYCRSGDFQGQSFPIPMEALRLGRSSQNQVKLTERAVSRYHAVVYLSLQGTYIRDEGSSLGTIVNEVKINSPTLLKPGDIIKIGYQQVFEYEE